MLTYRTFFRFLLVLLIFIGAPLVSNMFSAQATTIDVSCTNGVGNVTALITAIETSNNSPSDDIINLSASCVYTLRTVYSTSREKGPEGLPIIVSDSGTLIINGKDTIIERASDAPLIRLFHLNAKATVTLNFVTLQNGRLGSAFEGAAIFNEGGTLNIMNSNISNNQTAEFQGGGAIFNEGGTVTITNSTLSTNKGHAGAAIFNVDGTLTIIDSTVSNNNAALAGAIYNKDSTVTITNSTLAGNTANIGGQFFTHLIVF
jgi:hypothetical protein